MILSTKMYFIVFFPKNMHLINSCANIMRHKKKLQQPSFYSTGPLLSENITCSGGGILSFCSQKNADFNVCKK